MSYISSRELSLHMKLFISYRREDTLQVARSLDADLRMHILADEIFLDYQRIDGGEAWPDRLRQQVRESSVMLALVGNRWLTAQDQHCIRRIDDPDDWVRQEILLALEL